MLLDFRNPALSHLLALLALLLLLLLLLLLALLLHPLLLPSDPALLLQHLRHEALLIMARQAGSDGPHLGGAGACCQQLQLGA